MSVTHIEIHRIIAPTKPLLDFEDGLAMAEKIVRPIAHAFVDGEAKTLFLIPKERPVKTGDRSSITAGFFMGLCEELLELAGVDSCS